MPKFFRSSSVQDKENTSLSARSPGEAESEDDLEVPSVAAASTTAKSVQNNLSGDRFIAQRRDFQSLELAGARLGGSFDAPLTNYRNVLSSVLFNRSYTSLSLSSVRDPSKIFLAQKRTMRTPYHIASGPVKDAPDVVPNPNYSVLCQNEDKLFIALLSDIYSYHPATDSIGTFTPGSHHTITALACDAHWLLHSTQDALCVYDANTNALTKTIRNTGQFNTIVAEYKHGFYLSNYDDGAVAHYDVRSPRIQRLGIYDGLISLSYTPLDSYTVAMSFDDPVTVKLYDVRRFTKAKLELPHQKCSGVMMFSSFSHHKLMTVGGANDKSLYLWNTLSGSLLAQGTSENSLTGVHWLDENTIVAVEDLRLSTWFIDNEHLMCESQSTEKHTSSILTSTQNPRNKEEIATVGSDELLRFWTVKKPLKSSANETIPGKRARTGVQTPTIR